VKNKVKLFLVDDDAVFLKLLSIEFQNAGDFEITTFPTGELCLANLDLGPDVIILDYYLDGIQRDAMNGIVTLDEIKKTLPEVPVIMLSSQDSIAVAIECMHHKATDYVIKSETAFMRLMKVISDIFSVKKLEKQLDWYIDFV
jgi:DNA-binding NtrC family response regulator